VTAGTLGRAKSAVRRGREQLYRADRAVISHLPKWRTPPAVSFARTVSATAEPAIAGAVLVAGALIAARRHDWRACGLALAVPGGMVARRMASDLISRPRPPESRWLVEPEGYSLPSRHTTLAVLTAGTVAACAGAASVPRRAIPLLAGAGVGASRVYLGVHWPSDVLAGWLFAEGWLGIAELAMSAAVPTGARSGKGAGQSRGRPAPGGPA
jgi:membrane-associated phospholipid phosphatase